MLRDLSIRTLIVLIAVLALLAALNIFLPQNVAGLTPSNMQLPASPLVTALAAAGGTLVIYGALGLIGFILWRKLGLPDIWDARVTNRQRFLIPALVGAGIGLLIIVGDYIFAPINGIGHIPHPPFPTSIVAALAAGIGEETMFRLFFISFWTWLVSKIILRGRGQNIVFWIFAVVSAVVFGLAHLFSLGMLEGWKSLTQASPVLMVELVLLNGILSIAAAYYFKKFGLLAPVGIHFWADVVWHVIWGALL